MHTCMVRTHTCVCFVINIVLSPLSVISDVSSTVYVVDHCHCRMITHCTTHLHVYCLSNQGGYISFLPFQRLQWRRRNRSGPTAVSSGICVFPNIIYAVHLLGFVQCVAYRAHHWKTATAHIYNLVRRRAHIFKTRWQPKTVIKLGLFINVKQFGKVVFE